MARIFIDGFESGDLKLWDGNLGGEVLTGIVGMDGTYSCGLAHAHDYIQVTLPTAQEYYVAVRWRPIYPCYSMISFYNNTTLLGYVARSSTEPGDTKLSARRGSDGAILATSDGTFPDARTHSMEIRFKSHSTTGYFQVKENGRVIMNFSGNTSGTTSPITAMRFGDHGATNGYASCYIDNVIVDSTDWPGSNNRIKALTINAAGSLTQWLSSAGINYTCVDDVPSSETDYVYTNVVGKVDLYNINSAGTIGDVKCLQVQALATSESDPVPTGMQLALKVGVTTYYGATKIPSIYSTQISNIWQLNPSTSLPWAPSGLDNIEIGVKAVA